MQAKYGQLAQAGIGFDFLLPSFVDYSGTTDLIDRITTLDAFNDLYQGSILSVEGPNEVDNWFVRYEGGTTLSHVNALQADLYAAWNADVSLADIPVYNFTLGASSSNFALQTGDLTSVADYANLHAYLGTDMSPEEALTRQLGVLLSGETDVVISETGYTTIDSDRAYIGVDEATQAKYTLNTMLDAFALGVEQTFLYELFDVAPDPSNSNPEFHYGLFNYDGTPKLAATAVHNLMTVLADDGSSTSTAGPFAFGLGGLPEDGKSMVLEKSDGTHDLILWNEARIWDGTTNTAIDVAAEEVRVHLNETYAEVRIYDPLSGSEPIRVLYGVDAVTISLGDHPLIIEVGPVANASSGDVTGTAAEIAEALDALEFKSNLTSITLTDSTVLPMASVEAMQEAIARNDRALAAIVGDYSFAVTTAQDDITRIRHYDATGTLTSTVAEYYTAGVLTVRATTYPDGSSDTVTFTGGVATREVIVDADGSREEIAYGVTGQNYTTRRESYDASGQSVSVVETRADGTLYHTWERAADGSITDILYDSAGRATTEYHRAADGSTDTITYVAGVKTTQNILLADGTATSITFEADGSRATESTLYTDGHRETWVYGVDDQSYVTEHTTFDAGGTLVAVERLHADGTRDYTWRLDADGSTTAVRYNAAGVRTSVYETFPDGSTETAWYTNGLMTRQVFLHADGSRDEYQYGVTGQNYATQHDAYDASGQKVSMEQTRADGTLYHTWEKAADGAITDILYDSAGLRKTEYHLAADGSTDTITYVSGVKTAETISLADGTAISITFNADGSKATESTLFVDRHRETWTWGIADKSYVTEHTTLDSAGKLVGIERFHADGSYDYTWKINADGSISSARYDAAGLQLTSFLQFTDGTTDTTWFTNGVRTRESIVHADKSHDEYTFNADGTIKHDAYSAANKLLYAETIEASGMHRTVVYAAGLTFQASAHGDRFLSYGDDTYVFGEAIGSAIVRNFHSDATSALHDLIDLSGSDAETFSDLTLRQEGSDVRVIVSAEDSILLTGVALSTIGADDFLF